MKGFTLVELIVAICIAMIVTGLILVNYNTYNDKQRVKQAAYTLKNDLRYIETKASSGEKPQSGCDSLNGWKITFTSSSYSYQPDCSPSMASPPIATVSLPSGLLFSPVPSPDSFLFKVLSQGTTLDSDICITLSDSVYTHKLRINTGGDINDLGLNYVGVCP